jgi:hypothetical protein
VNPKKAFVAPSARLPFVSVVFGLVFTASSAGAGKSSAIEVQTEAARPHPVAATAPMPPSSPPPPSLSPAAPPPGATRVEPAKPAEAQVEPVDPRFALTAELGYSSNDLDIGLGIHAGKKFFPSIPRLYIGGAFVYHLGHTISSAQTAGYSSQASFSAFYAGPEGGYEFTFSPVLVRIYAGLGMAWLMTSATASGPGAPSASASSTQSQFVVWPGATAIYSIPDSAFYVGGDLRFVSVPGGPAVGFFASGGMHL